MADDSWKPIPSEIRTARRQHDCNDCGQPIEPGEKYEHTAFPPHRISEYDVDHWLTWRNHFPRFGSQGQFLFGCDMSAAYKERCAREAVSA